MPTPITLAMRRTHRVRPCSRRLFQIRETCLLKRFDLFADHGEPGHIAPQFINRVGGQRQILRCPQVVEALRRFAQFGIEAADPKPRQDRLHAVDDPRALAH